MDCAAITSLRTGAAAAVSAQALARDDARTVGLIGCGVNGAWAARCLAAAGYGPGVCFDPRPEAAEALAAELGWSAGDAGGGGGGRTSSSPSPRPTAPVIGAADLRPGQHLAVLGADAHGKAEVELDALARCRLFCDEWEQASKGGELSGPVAAGARRPRAGDRDRRRARRARAGPAATTRRSRCSTPPASRSRTSGSRTRCSRPTARAGSPRRQSPSRGGGRLAAALLTVHMSSGQREWKHKPQWHRGDGLV